MEPQITSDIKEIVNMVSTENRITRYVLKASNSISTGWTESNEWSKPLHR